VALTAALIAAAIAVGSPWIFVVVIVGGLAAGLVGRAAVAAAVPVAAAAVAAVVLELTASTAPFDVSPVVAGLLGAIYGLAGIPAAFVGMALGRRLWA
jgi:hypothetical protein